MKCLRMGFLMIIKIYIHMHYTISKLQIIYYNVYEAMENICAFYNTVQWWTFTPP